MNKDNLKQAVHELEHLLNDGSDYEKSIDFVVNRFSVDEKDLIQALNNHVMSI